MKICSFEPSEYAAEFAERGWVYMPGAATDEFCEYVRAFVAHAHVVRGHGITGAKDQYVLDFPEGVDVTTELFDVVAPLCGLDRARMTLSERHVKWYEADAAPRPRPHKDRFASQISFGVSIDVAEGSHLVLYPDDDNATNPLVRAGLTDTLLPEDDPEVTLRGARAVEVFDAPGDVVAFYGSRYWHLRRNPAGTMIVYFKFNDFGCDPLAEDPATPGVRAHTMSKLRESGDLDPGACPNLSRGFESVTRELARNGDEWWNVQVWDQPARRISEVERIVLASIDGTATVGEIAALHVLDLEAAATAVRRLAALGAVDL